MDANVAYIVYLKKTMDANVAYIVKYISKHYGRKIVSLFYQLAKVKSINIYFYLPTK